MWVKLDDGFVRHPRMVAAGLHGRALFVAGLCYCGAHLTDGIIPKAALPMLAAEAGVKVSTSKRLIEVGSWIDRGDSVEVHDYLVYNPSRDKVVSEREAGLERAKRSRETRANVRRTNGVSSGDPSSSSSNCVPSERATARDESDPFDEFWEVYPRSVGKPKARTAFAAALKRTSGHPEPIIAGARRYAADPNRVDEFTAHPTTWLNRDGWEDPPLPSRTASANGARPQSADVLERAAERMVGT